MTEQEDNYTPIEDQKSAQPLLFGFVALLIVASIFLIGLGLGFGVARLDGRFGWSLDGDRGRRPGASPTP